MPAELPERSLLLLASVGRSVSPRSFLTVACLSGLSGREPINPGRPTMRSQTLFLFAACFTALLAILLIVPLLKTSLDYAITAVSALSILNLLLQFAPLYCRCPRHGHGTYKVRWRHAGKWIRCRHCAGQLIQIPQPALADRVHQLYLRFLRHKPIQEIAFECELNSCGTSFQTPCSTRLLLPSRDKKG
jgi:hypothetical protein